MVLDPYVTVCTGENGRGTLEPWNFGTTTLAMHVLYSMYIRSPDRKEERGPHGHFTHGVGTTQLTPQVIGEILFGYVPRSRDSGKAMLFCGHDNWLSPWTMELGTWNMGRKRWTDLGICTIW